MTVTTDLTKVSTQGTSDEVLSVVKVYCIGQNITPDLLALVLELNSEVYTPFINGYFSNDGRTMEMFMRLFWIVGLTEADPSRFGVHSAEVNQWAVEHIEMIAGKRRELYRVAQESRVEAALRVKAERVAHALKEHSDIKGLCIGLWFIAIMSGFAWLPTHWVLFGVIGVICGLFGIFMGVGTIATYYDLKNAENA